MALTIAWVAALAISAAAQVAGRVVDADGAPTAEVWVTATWRNHPELPPRFDCCLGDQAYRSEVAPTDARGRFRVQVPPNVPIAVLAEHDGPAFSALRFPVSRGDFVELRLQPARELAGNVVNTGRRAVAARGTLVECLARPQYATHVVLTAFAPANAAPVRPYRTRTDREGHFRLLVPNHAELTLAAHTRMGTVPTRLDRGEISISLPPHGLVPVHVRTDAGPVGDAWVIPAGGPPRAADTSGKITLPEGSGGYLVVSPTRGISAIQIQEQEIVRVALTPGHRLHGRLVDAAGRPRSNARLLFHRYDTAQGPQVGRSWISALDDRGRIDVPWLDARAALLGYVEIDGRFVCFLHQVAGNDLDLGDFTVSDAHRITGTVSAVDRTPAAGAWVLVRRVLAGHGCQLPDSDDGASFEQHRVAIADRGGRLLVDGLAAGEYELVVCGGDPDLRKDLDAMSGVRSLRVPAVTRDEPVVIALPAALALRGVVVGPDDKPIEGAMVMVQSRFGRVPATTAKDGSFRLFGLAVGPQHLLVVAAAGYRAAQQRVRHEDAPLRIVLPRR